MCYVCFDSDSEENALDSRCSRSRAGSSDGDEDIIVNSEIIMSDRGDCASALWIWLPLFCCS